MFSANARVALEINTQGFRMKSSAERVLGISMNTKGTLRNTKQAGKTW